MSNVVKSSFEAVLNATVQVQWAAVSEDLCAFQVTREVTDAPRSKAFETFYQKSVMEGFASKEELTSFSAGNQASILVREGLVLAHPELRGLMQLLGFNASFEKLQAENKEAFLRNCFSALQHGASPDDILTSSPP